MRRQAPEHPGALVGRVAVAPSDLVHQQVVRAEPLREPPGGGATEDVHLEQAILGLRIAVGERGALERAVPAGEHMRHAKLVAQDRHRVRRGREARAGEENRQCEGEQGSPGHGP
jgi:hypothetical protein